MKPRYSGPERRRFGRRKTNIRGWVHVRGRGRLPCTVRNLSREGAYLEIERPDLLPNYFELTIEIENIWAACDIRHSSARGAGVYFREVRPLVLDRRASRGGDQPLTI